jgi:hypothetical protein
MKMIKHLEDKKELKAYFEGNLEYDKAAIKEKIVNVNNSFLPELEINFEKNIDNVFRKINANEDGIISGDFSYFLGVIKD